jgi:Protein kinase domain
MWRYSHADSPQDPDQGWKLHVSATVLTAADVLQRVAPPLCARGVRFKAPRSIEELSRLNSGLFYGYSQVGKFITVYPRTADEAASLARRLHLVTRGVAAPVVPFDGRYRPNSCVYYRYGAFTPLELLKPDGTRAKAIRAPDGTLVEDSRAGRDIKPEWVPALFPVRSRRKSKPAASPLTIFRAFRALSQRGKGGVYQAIDLSVSPPRLCVLKEGRTHGEVSWDGRDGNWRVRNEEHALNCLHSSGVTVPRVYASFEVGEQYYLVTEFVEGESLQQLLNKQRRRLPAVVVLRLGARLASAISKVHEAGWAWRDCKPSNVIMTTKGELVPLDFEGSCPAACRDPVTWCSPVFAPLTWGGRNGSYSNLPDDLYALGVTVYFMLAGKFPTPPTPTPIAKLRKAVPAASATLISRLLNPDPARRPTASEAARVFECDTGLSNVKGGP